MIEPAWAGADATATAGAEVTVAVAIATGAESTMESAAAVARLEILLMMVSPPFNVSILIVSRELLGRQGLTLPGFYLH
jgi:hypothetical protein